MIRTWLTLLVIGLLAGLDAHTALAADLTPPGATFFSPQKSPDGSCYLWESLDRGGSIWLADASGRHSVHLVKGHSPSWVDRRSFRFVVSRDDGHQVVDEKLYRYDLETGAAEIVAQGGTNPDYRSVPTSSWIGITPPTSGPLAGKVICIDPGHGKGTGAPCTFTGKREDVYVLDSAYLVRDYLEAAGATVRMTRFDDSTVPTLPARVNFSNACGAAAFVSVHLNSASNPAAHGIEVYFRSADAASKNEATLVHDAMVEKTGIFSRGVRPDKETLGYTLGVLSASHATHNKSLTEGCFLSNADDARLIEQPTFVEGLSWGIYAGLSRTLGKPASPQTTTIPVSVVASFTQTDPISWIGGTPTALATQTPEGDGLAGVVTNPNGPFTALRTGGSAWRDYRVSATVSRLEGNGTYGLVARCNQVSRENDHLVGYVLAIDEKGRKASLLLSGGPSTGATVLATRELPAAPARGWRSLTLECRGKSVEASVDGIELTPAAHGGRVDPVPVLPTGKAGVIVLGTEKTRCAVDRFAIEPIQ